MTPDQSHWFRSLPVDGTPKCEIPTGQAQVFSARLEFPSAWSLSEYSTWPRP